MAREELADLVSLIAVARERSFTRAAAQLGVSQSALSQTIRGLEERLGIRLLTRTTRSVSTTDAGERLLATVAPRLDEIRAEMAALSELRDRPAGTVRIASSEHAANSILWPKLAPLLAEYPELRLEIAVDNGWTDIAAERFDAGVRLGENLDKDMIAIRIGPDLRMVVVGSPTYFASHPAPLSPSDLAAHTCINLRLPSSGGLYQWEFEKDGRALRVRVEGQFIVNSSGLVLDAVLADYGLAVMMEDRVGPHLAEGRLIQVLDDWCRPFAGFHLYHPSRRQVSPVLALVIARLRYRQVGPAHRGARPVA